MRSHHRNSYDLNCHIETVIRKLNCSSCLNGHNAAVVKCHSATRPTCTENDKIAVVIVCIIITNDKD